MFKNQPKGLYALALANTGERFGYYTMLAIFTLFLQAKFGFSSVATSNIFAGFLALVYFLPILGGILADKFGYGKMVTTGIIVMFAGYTCLAIPTGGDSFGIGAMFGALFLIALGTGLFKGNLQVMVVIFTTTLNIQINAIQLSVYFTWQLTSVLFSLRPPLQKLPNTLWARLV